jgi:hypothetical protein
VDVASNALVLLEEDGEHILVHPATPEREVRFSRGRLDARPPQWSHALSATTYAWLDGQVGRFVVRSLDVDLSGCD